MGLRSWPLSASGLSNSKFMPVRLLTRSVDRRPVPRSNRANVSLKPGKADPTKASWTGDAPDESSLDPTATDSPLSSTYGLPGNPGDPEFQAGEDLLAEGNALGADESSFAAGGDGGLGGLGSLLSAPGGNDRGVLPPGGGALKKSAGPMYFDPNPSAAENIAVGNRALGHINFSSLFRGAKPNASYDPNAGPSPTNLPYEPTTGLTGGLKRFFLGNTANDLNASAMQQRAALESARENRQFLTDEAIRQAVQAHAGQSAVDVMAKPQIAGGVAQATGELANTNARTRATNADTDTQLGNAPFVRRNLELTGNQLQAQTDLTSANADTARETLYPTIANAYANVDHTRALTAASQADQERLSRLFPTQARLQEAILLDREQANRNPTMLGPNAMLFPSTGTVRSINQFGDMPGAPTPTLSTLVLGQVPLNDAIKGVPVGQALAESQQALVPPVTSLRPRERPAPVVEKPQLEAPVTGDFVQRGYTYANGRFVTAEEQQAETAKRIAEAEAMKRFIEESNRPVKVDWNKRYQLPLK